jgi:hypothetical protein
MPFFQSDTLSLTTNQSTSEGPPNVQQSLPSYSLLYQFRPSLHKVQILDWQTHCNLSRIQFTDMRPHTVWQWPVDMQSSPDKL